jgi:phospholipid/cholesterol/gamma-HCH transport system permease protein
MVARLTPTASLRVFQHGPDTVLAFAGRLDAAGAALVWNDALAQAAEASGVSLTADLTAVELCDTAGATLLLQAEAAHGARLTLQGAGAGTVQLIERLRRNPPAAAAAAPRGRSPAMLARAAFTSATNGIAFLGEVALALVRVPWRHRMLRRQDLLRAADQAGARAVPLVLLLGFLIGLILAFQSAIPLRRFGAELYVANLVAVSLLRELGPLLVGVILAGRTGSAFAAEIGTMKVNEELAALATMGLDVATMQVLPRLLAVLLVMPALTLLLDAAGLAGMALVLNGLGYPVAAVIAQVQQTAHLGDLVGGLFKALCFGALIAGIGCRAGMQAGIGPQAVGEAATNAVVGGIVAMIVLDGVFAVLFYMLGL